MASPSSTVDVVEPGTEVRVEDDVLVEDGTVVVVGVELRVQAPVINKTTMNNMTGTV